MTYSSILKRFVAALIDYAFVMVIYFVVGLIPFLPFILWPIITIYYHVVFETSSLRGTPGKVLVGIALVNLDGEKITIKTSLIRYCASLVSSFLLCAGYLLALFSSKKQTFHDTIANTVVIDGTFSNERMWDVFVNQSKMYYGELSDRYHGIKNKRSSASTYQSNPQTIEELYDLFQKGIITEDEYNKKKAEILSRI